MFDDVVGGGGGIRSNSVGFEVLRPISPKNKSPDVMLGMGMGEEINSGGISVTMESVES
jgi:hypothetical protein